MSPADARELQEHAHTILGESRFHARRTPSPFRGVLRWLGRVLEPVWHFLAPVGRVFANIAEWFVELWAHTATRVVLIGMVLAIASLLSLLVIKRRGASAVMRAEREGTVGDDPREVERAADQAEEAGDYAAALRLRFRAGVIRLQLNGRVRRGRSATTRTLARQLRSAAFDELGRTHDEVAYGGAPASADDARAAREQWDRVLSEKAS